MKKVFICSALRTPIGSYGGSLSAVRPDDLAASVINVVMNKYPELPVGVIDDVILGCANQAGEDNRNVARMAALLSGLPEIVPGVTVNRLCGSGMDAVGTAARAIKAGEAEIIIAGGVESMSRAPFVMGKATTAFARQAEIFDTTIGWRFINKKLEQLYGAEPMIETAENIAKDYNISREEQDVFAQWSQEKAQKAIKNGNIAEEIIPISIPQKKGEPILVSTDEHPRLSSLEKLANLKPIVGNTGTVTAGNASGVNDGAAVLLIASEDAVKKYNLIPLAEILGMLAIGVPPRIMGMGPVPATNKLLSNLNLSLKNMDIIELNEAFAAQALGCLKGLGIAYNDIRVNPQGGAIALGHPLGMSGARIITTAVHQLQRSKLNLALCTMCIGVGQGISMVLKRT